MKAYKVRYERTDYFEKYYDDARSADEAEKMWYDDLNKFDSMPLWGYEGFVEVLEEDRP